MLDISLDICKKFALMSLGKANILQGEAKWKS